MTNPETKKEEDKNVSPEKEKVESAEKFSREDAERKFKLETLEASIDSYVKESRFAEVADDVSENTRKKSQGLLEKKQETEYIKLAKEYLKEKGREGGLQEDTINEMSQEKVMDIVRNDEDFRKKIKENKTIEKLAIITKVVEKSDGKMPYEERIVLFSEIVPEDEDSFNEMSQEEKILAAELWEAVSNKNLNKEAEARIGGKKEEVIEDYIVKEIGIEISDGDLDLAERERKEDEEWRDLKPEEKKRKLAREKIDLAKKRIENITGSELTDEELIAFSRSYPLKGSQIMGKEQGFLKRLIGKKKEATIKGKFADGKTFSFVGGLEDIRKISELKLTEVKKNIDEVGKKWEKDLNLEKDKIILETRQKEAKELIELSYDAIIKRMVGEKIEEFKKKGVEKREKKEEFIGGESLFELLDLMIEDTSDMEDFIKDFRKALEILKKSGFDFDKETSTSKEELESKKEDDEKEKKDNLKKSFKEIMKVKSSAFFFCLIYLAFRAVKASMDIADKASGGSSKSGKK